MNPFVHLADLAFHILDSADVLHEFDNSVTLRIDRESWTEYLRQGND